MTHNAPPHIENLLLALLPASELQQLHRHLEPISFARKRVLYEAGQSLHNAYFFKKGMAALSAIAEDGRTVQVAIVGRDGFVGVPIIHLWAKTVVRIVTQTHVDAFKIDAQQLLAQCERNKQLRKLLLHYSQVLDAQIVQSTLCNTLHTIRQRLCRWLLICRDSSQSPSFDLTQQDIADMLGSHRNQISFEARQLGKRGFLRYGRGQLTLTNEKGLKEESCECYQTVRHWTDELLNK
jgi:CRP-like cAMP-binding protein